MTIVIDKEKTRFFISINKSGLHSFVTVGIYDQETCQVQQLLAQVGKYVFRSKVCGTRGSLATSNCMFNALFSKVDARLLDEKNQMATRGNLPVSYHASDITYEHYLEFIQLLELLQTEKNKYSYFKPIRESGNEVELSDADELTLGNPLQYGPLAEKHCRVKNSVSGLHVGNTCRHSGIELIEATQHRSVSPAISSTFLNKLPYSTELEYGVPSKNIPFYVLPASPVAYPDLDSKKKEIIAKLYKRMEHMLLINPNSEKTRAKFNTLKNLYLNMIGPQISLSLHELLISIQDWRDEHKVTLSALRTRSVVDLFFDRKPATMEMVKGIIKDLNQVTQTM